MQKTIQLPFPAADPFILRAADGRYYLYCTSEDGGGSVSYTHLVIFKQCYKFFSYCFWTYIMCAFRLDIPQS